MPKWTTRNDASELIKYIIVYVLKTMRMIFKSLAQRRHIEKKNQI